MAVGAVDGPADGTADGCTVGASDGSEVGATVGVAAVLIGMAAAATSTCTTIHRETNSQATNETAHD